MSRKIVSIDKTKRNKLVYVPTDGSVWGTVGEPPPEDHMYEECGNPIGDRLFLSISSISGVEQLLKDAQPEDLGWKDATSEEKVALCNQRVSRKKRVASETKRAIREEFTVEDELQIYRTDDTAGKARIAEIVAEGKAKLVDAGY